MRRGAVACLIAALPSLAFAAETAPCADLAAQQDRNACIAEGVRKADAVLNDVYRRLNDKLDATGKRNLVAAERAWIGFRDRECDFRTGYDTQDLANNGTLASYLVGQCRLELTTLRTTDLRRQMACPGGDPSCPP